MLPPLPPNLPQRAQVPEHSVTLMQAVSQGQAFVEGDYLFVAADDWLMAIGYPLAHGVGTDASPSNHADAAENLPPDSVYACAARYSHTDFDTALSAALKRTGATDCWAIGPDMPPRLQAHITEKDIFYLLPASTRPPAALRGPLAKAASLLRVEHSQVFTPAHRRLWAEFMGRKALKANVRELFARTPQMLQGGLIPPSTQGAVSSPNVEGAASSPNIEGAVSSPTTQDATHSTTSPLYLLNAWDAEGNLAACLLMDYSATAFSSYIIGAHSQSRYTAHAADLLFAAMLDETRRRGQHFVHLGLGVNEGIARFKRKWGGKAVLPYVLAAWQEETTSTTDSALDSAALIKALLGSGNNEMTKRQLLDSLPEQRPFAMLWEVEKNGKVSWLAGTAHFFCYSFESSFRRLFKKVDTLIFEGPLDPHTLSLVDAAGKSPDPHAPPDQPPLIDLLTEAELRVLERVVRGPEGFWPRFLNMEAKRKLDVRWYLRHTRPWCAMFTLWTGFLERQGWQQSVDLEAWYLGQEMGKTVLGMESVEEQLASLDAVPVDRVIRHFQNCRQWEKQVQQNVRAYLTGDLATMMGTSTEFPTRTSTIIGARDQRFRERMTPFIEAGSCVVFVGSAHLLNLRDMLRQDGFTLRRCLPTLGHRLKARWKPYVYE